VVFPSSQVGSLLNGVHPQVRFVHRWDICVSHHLYHSVAEPIEVVHVGGTSSVVALHAGTRYHQKPGLARLGEISRPRLSKASVWAIYVLDWCFSNVSLSLDRDGRLRQNGLHPTQQAIIWLEGGII